MAYSFVCFTLNVILIVTGICPNGGKPAMVYGRLMRCRDKCYMRGYDCYHGYCCPRKVYHGTSITQYHHRYKGHKMSVFHDHYVDLTVRILELYQVVLSSYVL